MSDKNAIVVDDGIATGYTVMSAINFLKGLKPKKLILATPVIAPDTRVKMEKIVDELICVKSEGSLLFCWPVLLQVLSGN